MSDRVIEFGSPPRTSGYPEYHRNKANCTVAMMKQNLQ